MTTAFTYTSNHSQHHKPGHVEIPDRLDAIMKLLRTDAIWKDLLLIEATPATLDDARFVHDASYLDRLQESVEAGGAQLDPDTYTTAESMDVALQSLGGLLDVTRSVLDGTADNGFAVIRPPGHHAKPTRQMGFCLLSNAAIAARWAQQHYGIERILIVDYDVHHGNGTQDVFYEDPNVLYVSTHQDPLWPGTGAVQETGSGEGEGTTVNVPLPPFTDDDGYLEAFRRILTPRTHQFEPELILLSAGYDAHWKDPLGSMNLSTLGFARLTREILRWAATCCDHRLVATLEGGYHVDALAHSVLGTVQVMQDPNIEIGDPFGPAPRDDTDVTAHIDDLANYHL